MTGEETTLYTSGEEIGDEDCKGDEEIDRSEKDEKKKN